MTRQATAVRNRAGSRRSGITLMEVLIAIGILAIGLSSIVALAPAGRRQAAQAVIADRSSVLAANVLADAVTVGLTMPNAIAAPGSISRTITWHVFDPKQHPPVPNPSSPPPGSVPWHDYLAAPQNFGLLTNSGTSIRTTIRFPQVMRLALQGRDDVRYDLPQDDTEPPLNVPRIKDSDTPPLAGPRAFEGRFSSVLSVARETGRNRVIEVATPITTSDPPLLPRPWRQSNEVIITLARSNGAAPWSPCEFHYDSIATTSPPTSEMTILSPDVEIKVGFPAPYIGRRFVMLFNDGRTYTGLFRTGDVTPTLMPPGSGAVKTTAVVFHNRDLSSLGQSAVPALYDSENQLLTIVGGLPDERRVGDVLRPRAVVFDAYPSSNASRWCQIGSAVIEPATTSAYVTFRRAAPTGFVPTSPPANFFNVWVVLDSVALAERTVQMGAGGAHDQ